MVATAREHQRNSSRETRFLPETGFQNPQGLDAAAPKPLTEQSVYAIIRLPVRIGDLAARSWRVGGAGARSGGGASDSLSLCQRDFG
ncbi:MAG: hypothetical protein KME26_18490 [Oscillatoria princeps RMCB-10]|nr:hypothetical protein [Oscillatoria princeps RMCB-10]